MSSQNLGGWRVVKLGDVTEVIGGGTPNTKKVEYWNGDIPWLTPRDFSNSSQRYWSRGKRNITELGFKNSSARKLPKGTILFTSRAPIGYIGIAECEVTTNQGFKSIIVNEEVNNIYMFYLLQYITPHIKTIATGTTFLEISGSALQSIEINLPPLQTQKRIADILSTFDDKIEVNNRICDNLESTARLLFRKNFVDNEECESWEIVKLSEVTDVTTGKRPTIKFDKISDDALIPIIGASGIMAYTNKILYDQEIITTGRVGTHGVVNRFYDSVWVSDNALIFISEYMNFIYFFLQTLNYKMYNVGSTQPLLTQTAIKNTELNLPPKELLKNFEATVSPMYQKIKALQKQNILLRLTRELFLPRLMRGEV